MIRKRIRPTLCATIAKSAILTNATVVMLGCSSPGGPHWMPEGNLQTRDSIAVVDTIDNLDTSFPESKQEISARRGRVAADRQAAMWDDDAELILVMASKACLHTSSELQRRPGALVWVYLYVSGDKRAWLAVTVNATGVLDAGQGKSDGSIPWEGLPDWKYDDTQAFGRLQALKLGEELLPVWISDSVTSPRIVDAGNGEVISEEPFFGGMVEEGEEISLRIPWLSMARHHVVCY